MVHGSLGGGWEEGAPYSFQSIRTEHLLCARPCGGTVCNGKQAQGSAAAVLCSGKYGERHLSLSELEP